MAHPQSAAEYQEAPLPQISHSSDQWPEVSLVSDQWPEVSTVNELPEAVQRHQQPYKSEYLTNVLPQNVADLYPPQQMGKGPWWRRRWFWVALFIVLVFVVVGVTVGIVVGRQDSGGHASGPISSPTTTSTTTALGPGIPTSFPASSSNTPPSACRGTICPPMLAVANSSSPPTLLLAALGTDGALWQRTANLTAWTTDWLSLGGDFLSQPAAASITPGRFDVFAVSRADQSLLFKRFQNGAWDNAWSGMAGTCKSPPAVCADPMADGDGATMHAVVTGPDHALYHKWYNASYGWAPTVLGDWENMGGSLSSSPAAACGGAGRLDVAVYMANLTNVQNFAPLQLYNDQVWSRDSWIGYNYGGGNFRGDPFVVAAGLDRTDSFGVGVDGAMYHWQWTGPPNATAGVDGTYGQLESLGGAFESTPFALWTAPSRLDVVAVGTDDRLKHKALIGTAWGTDWEDLGGFFNSAPTGVMMQPGVMLVFGLGPNGTVIHQRWGGVDAGSGYNWGNGTWFSDEGKFATSWYRNGSAQA